MAKKRKVSRERSAVWVNWPAQKSGRGEIGVETKGIGEEWEKKYFEKMCSTMWRYLAEQSDASRGRCAAWVGEEGEIGVEKRSSGRGGGTLLN